jgi:hypothetical protein
MRSFLFRLVCDISAASTAESVRESPRKVHIQYYEPMFSLFRSTCKNAICRRLVLLNVSRKLSVKYTYNIISQSFDYF